MFSISLAYHHNPFRKKYSSASDFLRDTLKLKWLSVEPSAHE